MNSIGDQLGKFVDRLYGDGTSKDLERLSREAMKHRKLLEDAPDDEEEDEILPWRGFDDELHK